MLKAIWMSDPHFTHVGDILGHDPRIRLQAAIDHINQHHHDARFCVISGDMVNRGSEADYDALSNLLDQLIVPVLPMVGNHDDRFIFRSKMPLPNLCMEDFIQFSVSTPGGWVLCLDTQKHGSDAGEFCAQRRAWLRRALKDAGSTPVYIFLHHPPMPLGLPMQDSENMENGEVFLDLLSEFECVKYLFIGHVHRAITGTIKGIPFSTMRSILYQAPPPRPDWNWGTFKPSEEAPGLGVLTVENEAVNLQFEQFCKFDHGIRSTI